MAHEVAEEGVALLVPEEALMVLVEVGPRLLKILVDVGGHLFVLQLVGGFQNNFRRPPRFILGEQKLAQFIAIGIQGLDSEGLEDFLHYFVFIAAVVA